MTETSPTPSLIGSLVASRRRRRNSLGQQDSAATRIEEDGLRIHLARTSETSIEGHVADPGDPDLRFVVELILDGIPSSIARADIYVPSLGERGPEGGAIGDASYGFVFALDPEVLPFTSVASVRLANGGEQIGGSIHLHDGTPFAPSRSASGHVSWTGGLDIEGWLARDDATVPARVEARIDDVIVAVARADIWRSVSVGDVQRAEPGFRLRLPPEWADGRLHEVDILSNGRPLPGSPISILAAPDGLAAFFDAHAETEGERFRGERFDRWFPTSVPFSDLDRWEARFPPSVPVLATGSTIAVIVIGEESAETSLQASAFGELQDWIGVVLPERDGRFEPADLRHFLTEEGATCEIAILLRAGTIPRRGGAARLASALFGEPSAAIAYGDVLLAADDGAVAPLALTAFDYERTLEHGCSAAPFAMRRKALFSALDADADSLDRLHLAPLDHGFSTGATHWHVPGFGFSVPPLGRGSIERLSEAVTQHLAKRGMQAVVEPRGNLSLPAVRLRRAVSGSVAILLDADGLDDESLSASLAALEATRARSSAALYITTTASSETTSRRLQLDGLPFTIAPPGVTPARRLAHLAESADADFFCLLDASQRPFDDEWLMELISRLADGSTGIAVPVLCDGSGIIREAGLSLMVGRPPCPRFFGCDAEDPGFGDQLAVAHQVSAVSSQALVTRRADFLALGGFDPVLFPRHLGAADYALKLQALGRRIVVAPDARLYRDKDRPPLSALNQASLAREFAALSARWATVLADDPYGSPLLRRSESAASMLAWPPGNPDPRRCHVSSPRLMPPGWQSGP